jgi:hypothetical protein
MQKFHLALKARTFAPALIDAKPEWVSEMGFQFVSHTSLQLEASARFSSQVSRFA